ncbi:MAG TPA: rhomboid family intramembrane serine protease [Myxococcaceae bacterium]|nr:rhomboid family intramembrane serine protease [Myxococcaceae bacterium]
MILLPVRVDDAEVDRLPWVSIAIAAVCAVFFIGTWLVPSNRGQLDEAVAREVLETLRDHPYLEVPPRLEELLGERFRAAYAVIHKKALEKAPESDVLAEEQRVLDEKVAAMFHAADIAPIRKVSMVFSRGFFQVGLLTHMFVHFGWEHFLGNMLFFYLAGLLLEDRWGRSVFAGFYFLGGFAAAATQYALDPHSHAMFAGASGAIAACMGAFVLRFPDRRIRWWLGIFYLFHWNFSIRAWICGVVWFLLQLLALWLLGAESGVALGAHVGGFIFGAVVAGALKWTGVEDKYIVPSVEQATAAYARHSGLDEAQAALDRGDPAAARKSLEAILAKTPDSADANVMLIKLEVGEDKARAHARAEKFLGPLLVKDSQQTALVVEELAPALDLSQLRPATAFRMGQALDKGPDGLRTLAEQLFAAAGRAPGPFAAKALLRAAQARLDANGEARGAVEYLQRLRALPGVQPDLLARVDQVEQRAQALIERERGMDPRYQGRGMEMDAPAPAHAEPEAQVIEAEAVARPAAEPSRNGANVVECQLGGLTRDVLSLVMDGGEKAQVSLANLLAVAVGVATEPVTPNAPPRNILYTDLVTSWGGPSQPAQVLRLKSSTLKLNNFYPGMKPQEAYGHFLLHLLDSSGATALPDAAALRRGEYPRFPDVETFTRALYG